MNIGQAFKMAWRSICGKKGRSALTILSIFIGIAAVMTIVSTMEGMKAKTMEQFAAMGSNRITVSVYSWMYDEDGNLEFRTEAEDGDLLYDEIGSVLKIKQLQNTKRELLEALELYFRVFFLGEEMEE